MFGTCLGHVWDISGGMFGACLAHLRCTFEASFPKQDLPCRGSYDVGRGTGDGSPDPDKRVPSIFVAIYKV